MNDKLANVPNQMAQALVRQQVDPNEVASCLAALRRPEMDGPRFFRFLDTVVRDGRAVVRSGQTLDYYRTIQDACRTYLKPYEGDVEAMRKILGWTVRLMRFYRVQGAPAAAPGGREPHPVTAQPAGSADAAPPPSRPGPGRGASKTGTVKFFRADRNFGFITGDDGQDIFVHGSAVMGGPLQQGQRVSYDVSQGSKGPAAKNVRPID